MRPSSEAQTSREPLLEEHTEVRCHESGISADWEIRDDRLSRKAVSVAETEADSVNTRSAEEEEASRFGVRVIVIVFRTERGEAFCHFQDRINEPIVVLKTTASSEVGLLHDSVGLK